MKQLTVASMAVYASAGAMTQQAGDNVATVGWFHIMPQDSSNNLTTSVINAPINGPLRLPSGFTSPSSGLHVNSINTLGLTLIHFFADNIVLTTITDVPSGFKLTGHNAIHALGPAGTLGCVDLGDPSNQPAVRRTRQWSPGTILQWYFGHAQSTSRPFVGMGVVYSFFTNVKLNPYFMATVNRELGSVLAAGTGKPGPTYVEGKSSSPWAPIFNLGANYTINEQWALVATVLYLLLKIEAATVIRASDDTTLAITKAMPKANPIITFVGMPYRF